MFEFYAMWASIVFVTMLGRHVMTAVEDSPMDHFKAFHECIANISLNSGNFGCSQSEDCLQIMFNSSEQFLKSNMETVKLEIQHSLDSLKHDCSVMFTEVQKSNRLCQTEHISSCLMDAAIIKSDMCRQMKNLSDCLRPVNSKCFNRIFASILRSISLGIWDNRKCIFAAESGNKDVLDVDEPLQIPGYQNLTSNMLGRRLDRTSFNDTNSSSLSSRQKTLIIFKTDLTVENVTVEEPTTTTKLPNSAKFRSCHYLLPVLPLLMYLIL